MFLDVDQAEEIRDHLLAIQDIDRWLRFGSMDDFHITARFAGPDTERRVLQCWSMRPTDCGAVEFCRYLMTLRGHHRAQLRGYTVEVGGPPEPGFIPEEE